MPFTGSIKPPIQQSQHSYSDAKASAGRASRTNEVLRDIPPIPVFEPTLEEFENISFEDYMAMAEKLIDPNIGCFKVSGLIQRRGR